MKCKHICVFLPSILGLILLIMFLILQYDSQEYYEQCLNFIEMNNAFCSDYVPPVSILFGCVLLILSCVCQWAAFYKSSLRKTNIAKGWSIIYPIIIGLTLFLSL